MMNKEIIKKFLSIDRKILVLLIIACSYIADKSIETKVCSDVNILGIVQMKTACDK